MHKLKQLSVSSFLRLLFAAFTFAFFCSAFIAPDRAEMFTGLRRIMTESSKVSTNYFDNGGYAGTFLNAGLVCLVSRPSTASRRSRSTPRRASPSC